MEITKKGVMAQTPEELNALMRAEQARINEAEKARVERDKRIKDGVEIVGPSCSVGPLIAGQGISADSYTAKVEVVRGTVILEGYYTIDDLKKYISLMEKYA
jgi:hypothetical protein